MKQPKRSARPDAPGPPAASPVSLVTSWFGVSLVGAGGVQHFPFPRESRTIAERLATLRAGEVLAEERAAAREAGEGVAVHDPRLKGVGRVSTSPAPWVGAPEGATRALLHSAVLELARIEAREAFSARDRLVVQKVKAVDELVKTANLLAERLREWYALHAPELTEKVADHETFARAVAAHGGRSAVAAALKLPDASPIGTDFREQDVAAVQALAASLASLYDDWHRLEDEVDREMRDLAPNLRELLGGLLAARLVAQVGTLERLASRPASTVQTLGAEGALFRHLREGTPPPKHGLIFQFEAVNRAPWWLRGRIARALAAAVTKAARADAYAVPEAGARAAGPRDGARHLAAPGAAGVALREALAKRVEAIRAAHPTPPPRFGRRPQDTRRPPARAAEPERARPAAKGAGR